MTLRNAPDAADASRCARARYLRCGTAKPQSSTGTGAWDGARASTRKAMGHPTRLFIIEELHKAERCVNELTEMIGSDVSTVSKHLSVLKNAGLVYDETHGHR